MENGEQRLDHNPEVHLPQGGLWLDSEPHLVKLPAKLYHEDGGKWASLTCVRKLHSLGGKTHCLESDRNFQPMGFLLILLFETVQKIVFQASIHTS